MSETLIASPATPPPIKKNRGKKKNWSFSAGPYRFRIRIYENPTTKVITGEMRDSSRACGYRSVVLRHPNGVPFTREEGQAWATDQSALWQKTKEPVHEEVPRLGRVLGLYAKHRTPKKSASEQKADAARTELWKRFLGEGTDLSKLELKDAESFIDQRRSGAIDARGNPVEPKLQKSVGDSAIGDDLLWLRGLIAWAIRWKDNGHYLMKENPTRGWPIPKEKNVRRPIATTDRYEALRRKSDHVMMTIGRGKKATKVRSYLSELLDLAYHTGRRISAIRQLRHEDLKLKQNSILWPRTTDKVKKDWLVPMSREVRTVIDRVRRDRPLSIGGYLFPSPTDSTKAVSKELVYSWLREAEDRAELPHLEQGGWHCFRRGWATARKGMPVQDLMAFGGWESPVCLETLYQQADQANLQRIADTHVELREVRQA